MFGLKVLCLTILATWGQAAIVTDRESLANELDEPQSLKSVILDVKERLDKWDAFFMGRLEPRMLGAATSLANLDTNIRNLQERAHIWDTFQLHVSAWNDQIQALDDKVNYLNEHLLTQENTALNTNGSLQQIVSKLTALESKMGNGVHHGVAPLFGDFAARGLLHTVRQLEHKLDKMQLSLDRIKFSQNKGKFEISEGEDMISAKETHEDFEEIFGHPTEVRHSGNPCRRLIGPAKKLFEGVEIIKRVLLDLVEETAEGDKSELRQRRRLPELGAIRNSLEDIEESITRLGRQQDRNVNENERILRRIDKKLDQLDREEDDNEREVLKRLKSIDRQLGGIKKEMDEDDNDSDDNDGRRRKNKNDTDEDDDDDSDDDDDDDDSDDRPRKKGKKNDDTDEDDDSDDNDRRKNKRKNKNDTDEDDDDDSDDDDRHKNKRRNKNDTDEDDDDSDEDDRHKNKRKNKNDTDEDDDDSDDDDRHKNKRKNKNDTDEDDDSDENGRKKNKSNDDTDEDDDDEDKRGKNKDTDEDDDTREKNDTDDDSDDEDEGGNGRNHRKSRETPLIVENGTTPLSTLLTNTGK